MRYLKKILSPGAEFLLPQAYKELAKLKTYSSPSSGLTHRRKVVTVESGYIEVRTQNVAGNQHDWIRIVYNPVPFYCSIGIRRDTKEANRGFLVPWVEIRDFNHRIVKAWPYAIDRNFYTQAYLEWWRLANTKNFTGVGIAACDADTILGVEYRHPVGSTLQQATGLPRFTLYKGGVHVGTYEITDKRARADSNTGFSQIAFRPGRFLFTFEKEVGMIDYHIDPKSKQASFSYKTILSVPNFYYDPTNITIDGRAFISMGSSQMSGGGGYPWPGATVDLTISNLYIQGRLFGTDERIVIKLPLNTLVPEVIWRESTHTGLGVGRREFMMVSPKVSESGDIWFTTSSPVAGVDSISGQPLSNARYVYNVWRNNEKKFTYQTETETSVIYSDPQEYRHGARTASPNGLRFIDFVHVSDNYAITPPKLRFIDTDHLYEIPDISFRFPNFLSHGAMVLTDNLVIFSYYETIFEGGIEKTFTHIVTLNGSSIRISSRPLIYVDIFYLTYIRTSRIPDKNQLVTFYFQPEGRHIVKATYEPNSSGAYDVAIKKTGLYLSVAPPLIASIIFKEILYREVL